MKYIQYIIPLCLCLGSIHRGYAQYSNPTLTTPTDIRSAGLGQLSIMSDDAPTYAMPTLAVRKNSTETLSLTYSFGTTPVVKSAERQYFQSLSSVYRLKQQSAVMLGLRHWSGTPTTYINSTETKLGTVYPQDWTLDIAYAYALNSRIKLAVGLSYLNTYNSQSSHSVMAHLAGHYQGKISRLKQGEYLVGLSVRHIGPKLRFGKENPSYSSLPTLVDLSIRAGYSPWKEHQVQLGMALRYYSSILGPQAWVYQTGLEYKIPNILALRLGAIYQQDNSSITVGLGKKLGRFKLNAAYSLQTYSQFNLLNLGLSVSL